ncbi:distal tail protein Dit [Enterococcus sp. AZ196]|uniref:distal tail protein Dit n=1 Tax=Enterococcus sp. AZ196 TaxID=2774659 RepID=UPI003D2873CC
MEETAMVPIQPYSFQYDGRLLERVFDTYRTTKVEGRGTLSVLFEVDQVAVGSKISTQKISDNTLKIRYMMYFEEFGDIRKLQRDLKQFLYKEKDVPIVFQDDPGIYYFGRLSKFDEEDITISSGCFEGSYEIYCQDPLKYSKTKQSGSQITIKSPVETTPEKIEVQIVRGSSIQIKNKMTGKIIKITGGSIYSGNTLVFDFDQGILLVNGVDKTAIIDLDSDFENFYIHRGDVLECNNGVMVVQCREVYI